MDFNKADQVNFPGGLSILMSVYRRDNEQLFGKAVESAYANTLLPDEFVLVIDGPIPPKLQNKIKELSTKFPLTVLPLDANVGLAKALNEGLKIISTEWVARADADDINLNHRFASQAQLLADHDSKLDLMGGSIQECELDGTPVAIRSTALSHRDILGFAKRRNPFNHMTVIYRTSLARTAGTGGYPCIHLKEDYALWASMLHAGARTANTNKILVQATAGRNMLRRRGGIKYAAAEIQLQRHLVNCHIKNHMQALFDGLMRATVFLLPSAIRGFLYERFLRI